jgi:hypothetical protein
MVVATDENLEHFSHRYEDGVIMEVILEKFTKYFRSVLHHNQRYFFHFVCMEIFNIILVFFNFWATDQFLQGRYKYFGWDVIMFYSKSKEERALAVNPFCATFPKEISCDVPAIGPSGGQQWHNGLCVLSQNVINEKIYLAIWFYITFVCLYTIPFVFYRICTLLFEPMRFYLIYGAIHHSKDPELRQSLKYVLSKCYLGDWFLLLQLSKNVNRYFYRAFIKELKKELKGRPKMSRAYADTTLTEERLIYLRSAQMSRGVEASKKDEKSKHSESDQDGGGTMAQQHSREFIRLENEQRRMIQGMGGRGRKGKGKKHKKGVKR